jgi:membrane protease YdiL (CAAX protease family)
VAEDLTEGHAVEPAEGAERQVLARAVERAEGWHPDPYGRFAHRWWDGEAWTASVTANDGGGVRWDPDPLDVNVAAAAPPAPGLKGIVTAFIGMAIGLILSTLVYVVVDRMDDPPSLSLYLLISSIALWTGLVGAVVVVSRRRGTGSVVRDFGLRFRWSDLGFGLAGAIVGRVVATASLLPLPLLDDDFEDAPDLFDEAATNGWSWAALIVVACVGAPLVEELFFRGLVQNRLVQRFGVVVGIGVASVLFGAAHLIGWEGMSTAVNAWAVTFGGIVLGATYHYSKRLGAAVIAHSLFNAVALVALFATTRS